MATVERRRQDDKAHEELNKKLDIMMGKLDSIEGKVNDAEKREAARAHIDQKVIAIDDAMHDNGKPGLLSIRNQWISMIGKMNTIQVALIIQILAFVLIEYVIGK